MKYEESDRIELKREMVDDLDKEIIAFLNSKGGTIYIGVEDDGTIVGVPKEAKDKYDEYVSAILTNNIKQNCRDKVSFNYDDNNVLTIAIKEGDHKPYYLSSKGPRPSGTYIRVGRSKRQATDDEILKLVTDYSGYLWEKEESENQNLHFSYLTIYFKGKDLVFDETKYLTLGFINNEGKFTNLAYLFSDENKIEVKLAKYDKNIDFLFKKEYTGSLCYVADQVIRQAEEFNITSAKIVPYQAARIEYVSYPGKSLREAILNALCHADYGFPSNIKIEFFPDRCRISNPGAIYKYTLEEVLKGQQSFRNPGVVRILFMLGFIENYGSGLPRIVNSYKFNGSEAILENMKHCFIVTLPNLNPIDVNGESVESQEDAKNVPNNVPNVPNNVPKNNEELIIDLIKENRNITRNELAAILKLSEKTITRTIANSNKIIRVGPKNGGHWEVND